MGILQILQIGGMLLLVVALFNLLIFVHELGHFWAARWRGLVVDRFAIWFGKPLWSKTINDVEYRLGWIPAGGYVSLPQMASMESVEGKVLGEKANLPPATPLDKIIVAFAGPLFSFLLALVFAVIVSIVGKSVSEAEATTVVGRISPGAPAEQAGIQPGDRILEIDGAPVTRWGGMESSVVWGVVSSRGEKISLLIERNGERRVVEVAPTIAPREGVGRKNFRQIGVEAAQTPVVASVTAGSQAEKAGVQPGDKITHAQGRPLYHHNQIFRLLSGRSDGGAIDFTVNRGGRELTVSLTPSPLVVERVLSKETPAASAGFQPGDMLRTLEGAPVASLDAFLAKIGESSGKELLVGIERAGNAMELRVTPRQTTQGPARIGMAFKGIDIAFLEGGPTQLVYPGPLEQIATSARAMANTLGALFSPKSTIKAEHLSGPVGIVSSYLVMLMSENGWRYALWFSVFLNVNLAILNLLPIPVLDGGHILLSLIEWVRRRPVNVRLVEFVQTACALLLMSYMLYVTFYDVVDIPRFFGFGGESEIQFVPEKKGK